MTGVNNPHRQHHRLCLPKRVRISVPPSPPPEIDDIMADFESPQWKKSPLQPRRSQRLRVLQHSQLTNVIVFPTDPVTEPPRFCDQASRWGVADLKLLEVGFFPDVDSHLSMLDVDSQWTVEQRESTPSLPLRSSSDISRRC
jgi:hypothetical protein